MIGKSFWDINFLGRDIIMTIIVGGGITMGTTGHMKNIITILMEIRLKPTINLTIDC